MHGQSETKLTNRTRRELVMGKMAAVGQSGFAGLSYLER